MCNLINSCSSRRGFCPSYDNAGYFHPGRDIIFTRQNATHDRLELSYLVIGIAYSRDDRAKIRLGLGLRVGILGVVRVWVRVRVSIRVRVGVELLRG